VSPDPRLDVALRHLLSLPDEDPTFEPQARAFIVGFIEEFDPKLLNIRKLADCFECLQTWFLGEEARAGLELLVERLARYYEGRASREMAASFEFKGKVEKLEWSP
jgi:hypothetical protein